jgi:hypothetical protein
MDGAMAQRVGRTWDLLNSRFEFGLRRLKIRKSKDCDILSGRVDDDRWNNLSFVARLNSDGPTRLRLLGNGAGAW